MEVSVLNIKGQETGRKVALNEAIFGIEPNDHVIYLDVVEQFGELTSEERRNDCWRCFVCSESVSVGCTHDAGFEESVVTVYTHESLNDEDCEAEVLFRCLARCVEKYAVVGRETPVVVLTRTVDAIEWFFVKQYAETVFASHTLHE